MTGHGHKPHACLAAGTQVQECSHENLDGLRGTW
jgi:hypothetical protein